MARRKIPARLDVLLAPKARKAVVLRRGPAKFVCTVGWDLTNDTFQLGQWVKGRIHAFCCDLSPDGRYFVYYFMKPDAYPYHWTAVSLAPYLKAIGRWKVEAGIYGGGLFISNDSCWLRHCWGVYEECKQITQELTEPADEFSSDWRNVYFRRLARDGWRLDKRVNQGTRLDALTFVKPLDDHSLLRNVEMGQDLLGLGAAFLR
jgi:hypothetical protein